MNTRSSHPTGIFSRPRGGVFFTALVIIGIMSISILAMLQYATYQQRMTHRRVEREAVYYAAEAGVDQVVHYFNFPAEYQGGVDFRKDLATDSYYTLTGINVFSAQIAGGHSMNTSNMGPRPPVFGYAAGDGEDRAHVSSLTVSTPTAADLAFSGDAIMVVLSEGQNAAGQTRIVRATLTAEPPFLLTIPAAIISLQDGDSDGQANLRWGEAWFKNDFQLPNGGLNNIPTTTDDPYVNFRTEQNILMNNGDYADGYGGSNTPLDPSAPNYYQPWGDDGAGGVIDPEHTNIYQHAVPGSIPFPDPLDYDFWKSVAQSRGLYFSWNASGDSLVVGQGGAEISSGDFLDFINQAADVVTGIDGASQSLPDPLIVFVDTLDGNSPAADGSNLCDLRLMGGGETFFRGVIYVGGDVTMNIRGTDDIWLQDPAMVADPNTGTEVQVDDLFMNGLFYCEGEMNTQGNPAIYGSLFARGGFGANGNPMVWYDARLAQGLPFSFNSNVAVARQVEVSPDVSTP